MSFDEIVKQLSRKSDHNISKHVILSHLKVANLDQPNTMEEGKGRKKGGKQSREK